MVIPLQVMEQQTVTIANMLQFGAQIFGILLVSLVSFIGPAPLVLLQIGVTAGAAGATQRLSPSPAEHEAKGEGDGNKTD